MTEGEFLTRGTIWVTIVGYALGSGFFALPERIRWRDHATRFSWTIAGISLIAHFICAFQFYHSWSQTNAYLETARQTNAVVGLNWGGGLFINYAFLVLWIVDIGWWWVSGLCSYRNRPWPLIAVWHSFLIFIIFNATVVFKDGVVRWIGVTVCVFLVATWVMIARRTRQATAIA